ncbi:MAG: hypothetical protein ACR2QC_01930 [Gammaproteobacteria bacterium]
MKNLVFSLIRPYGAVFGAISAIFAVQQGGGGGGFLPPCLSALNSPFAGLFSARFSR